VPSFLTRICRRCSRGSVAGAREVAGDTTCVEGQQGEDEHIDDGLGGDESGAAERMEVAATPGGRIAGDTNTTPRRVCRPLAWELHYPADIFLISSPCSTSFPSSGLLSALFYYPF